jgi:hypothetical protein
MNRIEAKGKVVNDGEVDPVRCLLSNGVEAQFAGKNLTPVGGIKLFCKFVRKPGGGRDIGTKH